MGNLREEFLEKFDMNKKYKWIVSEGRSEILDFFNCKIIYVCKSNFEKEVLTKELLSEGIDIE